jgi:hypothetical protein
VCQTTNTHTLTYIPTKVAVRVRPLNTNDKAANATIALNIVDGTINVLKSPFRSENNNNNNNNNNSAAISANTTTSLLDIEHTFNYDFAFDSSCSSDSPQYSSQKDVFNNLGIPIVLNACRGYNASIFAYGQTGRCVLCIYISISLCVCVCVYLGTIKYWLHRHNISILLQFILVILFTHHDIYIYVVESRTP